MQNHSPHWFNGDTDGGSVNGGSYWFGNDDSTNTVEDYKNQLKKWRWLLEDAHCEATGGQGQRNRKWLRT